MESFLKIDSARHDWDEKVLPWKKEDFSGASESCTAKDGAVILATHANFGFWWFPSSSLVLIFEVFLTFFWKQIILFLVLCNISCWFFSRCLSQTLKSPYRLVFFFLYLEKKILKNLRTKIISPKSVCFVCFWKSLVTKLFSKKLPLEKTDQGAYSQISAPVTATSMQISPRFPKKENKFAFSKIRTNH